MIQALVDEDDYYRPTPKPAAPAPKPEAPTPGPGRQGKSRPRAEKPKKTACKRLVTPPALFTKPGRPALRKKPAAAGVSAAASAQALAKKYEAAAAMASTSEPAGVSAVAPGVAKSAGAGAHPAAVSERVVCKPVLKSSVPEARSDDEEHVLGHGTCEHQPPCRSCPACISIAACPRCYYRGNTRSMQALAALPGSQESWLCERPKSWGGKWALGCVVCYNYAQALQNHGDRPLKGQNIFVKFLHRSVRSEHLTQHASMILHAKAVLYDQGVEVQALDSTFAPFSKGLPQASDFMRTWQDIRAAHSGRSVAAGARLSAYIAGEEETQRGHQKDLEKLAYAMAEAIREEDRAFLLRATYCSLCIDASASRNVVSFHASCTTGTVVEQRDGLIGIVDEDAPAAADVSAAAAAQGEDAVDLARRRKSDRSKLEIMDCIRRFCSPGQPGRFDDNLFEHLRSIIVQLTFDGASEAQRAGRLLALDPECLPKVQTVVRDRAHAVRTNLRAPLASDDEMKRIRHAFLDKEGSLAKLIQYHPRARSVHEICQQAVLSVDGEQGGGLKTTLANFSFANQRFESEELPARRIVCTLQAFVGT